MHRWFNNPAATASLMEQRDSFSLEEAEAWVGRAMDDSGEDRKYAIEVEGYEEPVGFTALYGLFRQTAPELGALIGDDVRGKGVGRRAEALTLAKAFDEFGAHRVYGRIPARNEVAKKTVAGLGWKHEGTMRAHLRREGAPAGRLRGLGRAARRVPRRRRGPAQVSRPPVAELIEDRGEAAAGEEFFRSRPFLDAEGVTHTLRIATDRTELLAPLIVREIAGATSATRSPPTDIRGSSRGVEGVSPGASARMLRGTPPRLPPPSSLRRSTSPRPASSRSSSATPSATHRSPAPASATWSRSPTRRCRARAAAAIATRSTRTCATAMS